MPWVGCHLIREDCRHDGRMFPTLRAFPDMSRRSVIDVARCDEAPSRQITRYLELVETCLSPSVVVLGVAPTKRSPWHSNVSRAS